jgi:aspartate aminotransferase
MRIANRILEIEESKTIAIEMLIRKLRSEGKNIISFGAGQPSEPTYNQIISATKDALNKGRTTYSIVSGENELKEFILKDFPGEEASNVIVSNGAKQVLANVFSTITNPGDEIIVPAPYWVSFSTQIKLCEGIPVFVEHKKDNQLDIEAIEAAITEKTKAIIINTPNNPTGAVYTRENLEELADFANKKNLFIISDECYDSFVYDGVRHVSPYEFESIRNQLLVIRSFSKNYSMTGFRIGYGIGPIEIIKGMTKLQGHITGNVCTFAQHGARGAAYITPDEIEKRRQLFEKKRDIALRYTQELFDCDKPQGAFYLFPNIQSKLNGRTSEEFCLEMIEKAGVGLVPGEAFGKPGYIRISYTCSVEELHEGFRRLKEQL